ncbi:MAG TPA: ABC transporter permease [Bryobacteraceae bacterium]|jgi:predicted permease
MPLWNSLRYATRQLRKSPVFTVTAILTLGLCIGANTAIYTLVDTLFFRPLPYPDPARLVMVSTIFQGGGASGTNTSQTGAQWELVRDHASLLDSAVYGSTDGVNLYAAGRVEYVQQQRVSANYFHVLGIRPLIGRELSRQEDVPGGPALTVLSYGLWQRIFHGDPAIAGRTIDLRGAPYTVIGIMPRGFRTDESVDLWTPLRPSRTGEGEGSNYSIIGRLKPGVTFAAASGQLNVIMQPLFKDRHLPPGVSVEERAIPLQAGLTSDVRSKVRLMWGAVGLVLLIGCVNIAGILLARSVTRSREIATRLALGAGRTRVIEQLLAEAILLAACGGLLGLGIGQLALKGLLWLNPGQFAFWSPVHLDARVMAVMLAIALGTSLVFGLVPAFEATSVDLRSALSEGGRGASGSRRPWKRQALVFAEVALGVVLVAAAGLLIRTFSSLMNRNPGFNPNHVMSASLSLQDARYNTAAAGVRLFRESLERIRAIPGVESAAVALSLPYQRPLNIGVERITGHDVSGKEQIINCTYVTPGFFETLQIPLLRGRVLTEADTVAADKVAVVNQAFVDYYLPNEPDPLGTLVNGYRIVGVVANIQEGNGWGGHYGPINAFRDVYIPASQFPDEMFAMANTWFSPSWIVRTRGTIPGLPKQMRRALQAVDPQLPFSGFHSMTEVRAASLAQQRYWAALFSALGGLALGLAALGLYSLIAQSVAQRTREMGIRLALGATVQDVVRAAAGPGITLAVAGIGAGLILAFFATRLMKGLIWGVTPNDPLTFIIVAGLLVVVAALSSILPALRLIRLDPAVTLRSE